MTYQIIAPKNYTPLGRVYCSYCNDTHYFDLARVDIRKYSTEYILSFDYKEKSFWFFDRLRDRKRLLALTQLKETIEGVSCDIKQVKEIVKLLPESPQEPIDLKWIEVDEFFAIANIFESSELIVTLELQKHDDTLYFESVNFCYKLPVTYTKKELRRAYLRYLFYNYPTPFYTNEVMLEETEAQRLHQALRYVVSQVSSTKNQINYSWGGEKPPGEE